MNEHIPISSQKSWIERNLAWFIPSVVVLCLALLFGFIMSIMTLMKSSGPYKEAMMTVRNSTEIQMLIGTPIEDGLFFSGEIQTYGGGSGNASINIPIEGPKDSGVIYLEATKEFGEWTFNLLKVKTNSGEMIDLLE